MRLAASLLLCALILTSVFWRLHVAERQAEGRAAWSLESSPAASTGPANDSITMVRGGAGVVEAEGAAAGAVLIDSDGKRYTIAPSARRKTASRVRAAPPAPRDPRRARRAALAMTAGILALGGLAVFFARKRLLGR